jgi:hypothetical protein
MNKGTLNPVILLEQGPPPINDRDRDGSLKKISACASYPNLKPDQVLCGSVLANHSQRIRSAMPIIWRLGMPRPPNSLGQHVLTQATAHFPPEATSEALHRNPRITVVMVFTAQVATLSAMKICTGMAQKGRLHKDNLPLLLSNLPFQVGIRLATLSTSGCVAALGNLPGERAEFSSFCFI